MTPERMISQLTALYGPRLEWGVDDFLIGVVEDIGYEPLSEAFSDRGLELRPASKTEPEQE